MPGEFPYPAGTDFLYLVSSDFLTNSYNKGGLISVMALSGLFLLITEYGLEYPEFYNKLYALLEPSMFIAKYRARFFEVQHCFLVCFFPRPFLQRSLIEN